MARDLPGTTTDYFAATDAPAIDITGTQLSLFCWFQTDQVDANDRVIIAKSQYVATSVQYNCGVNNGRFWFEIGDAAGTSVANSPVDSVRLGHWHAGLGILDGTSMLACVDGKIGSATTARSIQNTGHTLTLGVRNGFGGGEFDGRIAHVAIWGTALKRDEMHRLTVLGELPPTVRPEQLRAYYPLEDYGSESDAAGRTGLMGQNGTVGVSPGPWLPKIPLRLGEDLPPLTYAALQWRLPD